MCARLGQQMLACEVRVARLLDRVDVTSEGRQYDA